MTQTKSTTVGPIIFGDETARTQLVEEGEVVTFRRSSRTTGETWWRKSRHGPKQGDVVVQQIEEVDPAEEESLSEYRQLSGFKDTKGWQDAIRELNGSLPPTGYLYRVVLQV